MWKVLITYATMSGSTGEVAQVIGEEVGGQGIEVGVQPLEGVIEPEAYDAVVIGAPMIMGWHRSAIKFLKKHRHALSDKPVALFATAMSLVSDGDEETTVNDIPAYVDQDLSKSPRNPGKLTLRERYARLENYATPMLRAAGSNRPVSLAFFGGKLDYFRLKPLPRLFVMLAVQAQPGDRRNWQAIRAWGDSLPALLNVNLKS